MKPFQIKIADTVFEVHCGFDATKELFRDYLCDADRADRTVSVSCMDIVREHFRTSTMFELTEERAKMLDPSLLHRRICDLLVERQTLMLHGCVVATNDAGVVFVAPSGVGKTTHAQLWLSHLPESYILNGDKPMIRVADDITVFGTPWCGKEGFNRNTSVKLKAICVLKRSQQNQLRSLTVNEAVTSILGQVYFPKSPELQMQVFSSFDRMVHAVRLYQLDMDNFAEDAFTVSSQILDDISRS